MPVRQLSESPVSSKCMHLYMLFSNLGKYSDLILSFENFFFWKILLQFGFIQSSSKFSNLDTQENKLHPSDAQNLTEGK